jgi:hypothetical protein
MLTVKGLELHYDYAPGGPIGRRRVDGPRQGTTLSRSTGGWAGALRAARCWRTLWAHARPWFRRHHRCVDGHRRGVCASARCGRLDGVCRRARGRRWRGAGWGGAGWRGAASSFFRCCWTSRTPSRLPARRSSGTAAVGGEGLSGLVDNAASQ